jgi:hypothetical protein
MWGPQQCAPAFSRRGTLPCRSCWWREGLRPWCGRHGKHPFQGAAAVFLRPHWPCVRLRCCCRCSWWRCYLGCHACSIRLRSHSAFLAQHHAWRLLLLLLLLLLQLLPLLSHQGQQATPAPAACKCRTCPAATPAGAGATPCSSITHCCFCCSRCRCCCPCCCRPLAWLAAPAWDAVCYDIWQRLPIHGTGHVGGQGGSCGGKAAALAIEGGRIVGNGGSVVLDGVRRAVVPGLQAVLRGHGTTCLRAVTWCA